MQSPNQPDEVDNLTREVSAALSQSTMSDRDSVSVGGDSLSLSKFSTNLDQQSNVYSNTTMSGDHSSFHQGNVIHNYNGGMFSSIVEAGHVQTPSGRRS